MKYQVIMVCYKLQGKVELEIEILTAEEAEEKKAGLGRSEPNENPTLEPPEYVSLKIQLKT